MCPRSMAGVPSSQALPGILITAPPCVLVPPVLGTLAVWMQTPKKREVKGGRGCERRTIVEGEMKESTCDSLKALMLKNHSRMAHHRFWYLWPPYTPGSSLLQKLKIKINTQT